jgi:hypothetical protein
MSLPVTSVMLIFWLFMAYRAFQRGDIPMAAVLTLVGVVLTVYRLKTLRRVASNAGGRSKLGAKTTVRLSPNKALQGTSPKLRSSFGAAPELGRYPDTY